jgi:hypothetical protein
MAVGCPSAGRLISVSITCSIFWKKENTRDKKQIPNIADPIWFSCTAAGVLIIISTARKILIFTFYAPLTESI